MGPLAVAGIVGGAKLIGGIAQFFGGKRKLRNLKLPKYEIPKEYETNIGLAQSVKEMGMPKAEYQGALQNIMRNQTAGISALQDRRSALAGIGNIVQRSNDATLNLDATAGRIANQNRMAGTQMEMNARQQLGMQKLAKQQWEKFMPYQQKMAEGQALVGAGMQNMFGAIDTAAQVYMLGSGMGDETQMGGKKIRQPYVPKNTFRNQ